MISVVIPTFNEKENIKKIPVMLQEIKIISEIILLMISQMMELLLKSKNHWKSRLF